MEDELLSASPQRRRTLVGPAWGQKEEAVEKKKQAEEHKHPDGLESVRTYTAQGLTKMGYMHYGNI